MRKMHLKFQIYIESCTLIRRKLSVFAKTEHIFSSKVMLINKRGQNLQNIQKSIFGKFLACNAKCTTLWHATIYIYLTSHFELVGGLLNLQNHLCVMNANFFFFSQTQYLADFGGRSVDEVVKRMMRTVIHSDLAVKYNMKGENEKYPFGESILYTSVFSKYSSFVLSARWAHIDY